MKETEARELLGMLKAATTQYPLDDETVGFWLDGMVMMDAELATKAVLHGIKGWRQFPPWAEFYEVYRMFQRSAENLVREALVVEEGHRGESAPEWVWVWSWARYYRDPREERPFPQQSGHVDEAEIMTQDEYEVLVIEWKRAGEPKAKNPLPLALR